MCCKNIKKRTLLERLLLFGKRKNRLLFGRLWNAVITSRHKMEMKYSDKGTLVQRQRNARTATTVPSLLSFTAVLTNEPLRTEHNFTTFSV